MIKNRLLPTLFFLIIPLAAQANTTAPLDPNYCAADIPSGLPGAVKNLVQTGCEAGHMMRLTIAGIETSADSATDNNQSSVSSSGSNWLGSKSPATVPVNNTPPVVTSNTQLPANSTVIPAPAAPGSSTANTGIYN